MVAAEQECVDAGRALVAKGVALELKSLEVRYTRNNYDSLSSRTHPLNRYIYDIVDYTVITSVIIMTIPLYLLAIWRLHIG